MDYAIKVKYASVELDEDSYEEGEGDYITEWELMDIAGCEYMNAQDLIDDINGMEDCFSSKVSDYVYMDDSTIPVDKGGDGPRRFNPPDDRRRSRGFWYSDLLRR